MYRDLSRRRKLAQIIMAILVLIAVWSMAGAQSEFPKLCIDVDTMPDTSSLSFRVSWKFTNVNNEVVTPSLVSSIIVSYTPQNGGKNNKKSFGALSIDSGNCTFDSLKYNQGYTFKVEALGASGTIAEVWSQPVGVNKIEGNTGFFRQIDVSYRKSSLPGKFSFIIITVFFIFAFFFILPFRTWPAFRSVNIFPYTRARRNKNAVEYIDLSGEVKKSSFGIRIEVDRLRIFFSDSLTVISILADKYIFGLICGRYLLNLSARAFRRKSMEYVEFSELPTVKILNVGLKWQSKHNNINDAFDIRISSEADALREKGYLEVLWGLGVTSPLLGLYGTVTGLIRSFGEVAAAKGAGSAQDILKALGGGINEALWTTFFGLTSGIILMLIYYYYNYKLGRITAIWENIATEISENI